MATGSVSRAWPGLLTLVTVTACNPPCEGADCAVTYARAAVRRLDAASLVGGTADLAVPDATCLGEGGLGHGWALAGGAGEVWVGMGAADRVQRVDGALLAGDCALSLSTEGAIYPSTSGEAFGSALDWQDHGDGTGDLLVGAPAASFGPTLQAAGQAYLFRDLSPAALGTLIGTSATAAVRGDGSQLRLGERVALCGDLDGDGVTDAAVAATGAELQAPLAGAVFVLGGGTTGGSIDAGQLQRLDGGVGGEGFGRALWCAGSLDGDGLADLVVGAPWAPDATGRLRAGAVTLHRGGALGVGEAAWTARGSFDADELGAALAFGDVDGDGVVDLLVGAPGVTGDSGDNDLRGAVYGWSGAAILDALTPPQVSPESGPPDWTWRGVDDWGRFGADLSLADLDGDGVAELLVGAPSATAADGSLNAGAVYLFPGEPGGPPEELRADDPGVLSLELLRPFTEAGRGLAWLGGAEAPSALVVGTREPD